MTSRGLILGLFLYLGATGTFLYSVEARLLRRRPAVLSSSNVTATFATVVASSSASQKQSQKEGLAVSKAPPCACEAENPTWKVPNRAWPTCVFIDLGAGDGETFRVFLGKSQKWQFQYDTKPYRPDQCYAFLYEANPRFNQALHATLPLIPQKVYPQYQTGIYMCDKEKERFYLDVSGPGGWGSSLNGTHEAVKGTAERPLQAVDVKLANLNRILKENTLPQDTVVVKMDVEGAEWDVLPCLAQSSAAGLVDALYLENHCPGDHWCPTTGQAGNSRATFDAALATLRSKGVKIPADYWSPMM